MAMAFTLSAIPNEIFDRIFSFLSEDKRDISTCRLVCHWFKQLSSPYLITSVVFARRLRSIAHLVAVLDHEYFHKYVTELICDSSSYNKDRATNWDAYFQRCLSAEQELTDAEWAQRKLEDQNIWNIIEKWEDAQSSLRMEDGNINRGGLHDGSEEAFGRGYRSRSKDEDGAENEGTTSSNEDEDGAESEGFSWSEHWAGALQNHDEAYRLGCHRSFPDYHRLYVAQKHMEHEDTADYILRRGFSRLKRLCEPSLWEYTTS